MKKLVSMALALLLTLSVLSIPAMAETESDDGGAIGYLSFLNLSEEEIESRRDDEIPVYRYLEDQGVMEYDRQNMSHWKVVFYDSLDAMLMGLMSGEVDALNVPDCTAKYLTNSNDQIKQSILYHPEKAEEFSQNLLNRICNGYSFMMLEENSDLRDQFDQVIAEMKEDGTLDELIQKYITDGAQSGETEAIVFEQFDGDPIKVAVTGSLPPMDYVAADGTPAGFNAAVLAEIGKRLGKNIELVQVDSVGRALALAQGNVDAVFWTRGASEGLVADGLPSMSEEEQKAFIQEEFANYTEEERSIMENLRGASPYGAYPKRDMPEGTVITAPYYTDLNVVVTLK
jgi:ABC-type amino acid transport substrate-binding protein